jgi:hypothetical protein
LIPKDLDVTIFGSKSFVIRRSKAVLEVWETKELCDEVLGSADSAGVRGMGVK